MAYPFVPKIDDIAPSLGLRRVALTTDDADGYAESIRQVLRLMPDECAALQIDAARIDRVAYDSDSGMVMIPVGVRDDEAAARIIAFVRGKTSDIGEGEAEFNGIAFRKD